MVPHESTGLSPFLMIYGGTIKKGFSKLLNKDVNISTCYEAAGAFNYGTLKAAIGAGEKTPSDVMDDLEQHACPGAGACGGMYTANTMSSALEALGMSLPYSSSTPALYPRKSLVYIQAATLNLIREIEKIQECVRAAGYLKNLLEKDIKPRSVPKSSKNQ